MVKLIIKHSTWLYFGWVFFIGLLTLLPGSYIPSISWDFISIDKAAHIILFSVMVFLGLTATKRGKLPLFSAKPILFNIMAALTYGYSIELLQSFIPQRSYDFADLAADCVGTLVGYGLFLGISKFLPIKHT